MKKPGENFIYTLNNIEYFATIISHDKINKKCVIQLLGQENTIQVPDTDIP